MTDVKTRILLRSDVKATWSSVNPTLLKGEVGIEFDPRATKVIKVKIGDGATAWNSLPYFADFDGAIATLASSVEALEEKVGTESVATQIATAIAGLADVYQTKLPTGETGKFLTTDASGHLVWESIQAGGVWGSITGDIADQEDLQEALDAKQDEITATNKLNATLVEEATDKQFVTAAEKQKISDAATSGDVASAVGQERSAREEADTQLSTALTAETNARAAADSELDTKIGQKVDIEAGKSLIEVEKITKLDNIEDNAQVNIIEVVKVNDTELEVDPNDKSVNIDLSGYTTDSEHSALAGRVSTIEDDYLTSVEQAALEAEIALKANIAEVYSKSETYNKTEVDNLIAGIKTIKYEVVDELPEADAEHEFNTNKTVYMMLDSSATGQDVYDEFICINKGTTTTPAYAWEKIGSTRIDLSNYYTKSETNTLLDAKQDTLTAGTGIKIEDNVISAEAADINEKTFVFEDDLETMYTLGKYTGTLANPATIPAAGKTFEQVWKDIFQKENNPSTTQPSVTVKLTNAGSYEVGTSITPAYTTTFSAGSYTYGPATGVTASDYNIKFNSETLTTTSGSFTTITLGDGFSQTISGTFDHTDGSIPVTNIGNEYPTGQIKAKDNKACAVDSSKTISSYRNMFFGTMTTKPETMVSSDIRSLTTKQASAAVSQKVINIPTGCLRVVFAVPSNKHVTSVLDVNGMGAEILSSFATTTINVEGANGYTAASYNVYYLDYANPNDKANTYKVTVA